MESEELRDRLAEIKLEPRYLELCKATSVIDKARDLMKAAVCTLIYDVNAPIAYSPCLTDCGLVMYFRISSGLVSAACQCNGYVLVEFDDKKNVLMPAKAVEFINGLFANPPIPAELD